MAAWRAIAEALAAVRRVRWARAGAVAAAAALAVGTADRAAAAPPPLRQVATGVRPAVTDGLRFAVVDLTPPYATPLTLRILDSRRNTTRTLQLGDSPPTYGPGPECSQSGVGGGQLLWACQKPSPSPPLADARVARVELLTGRLYRVPGLERLPGRYPQADHFSLGDIGAFWLAGSAQRMGSPVADYFLLNWRTGAVRQRPRLGTREILDLDSGPPVQRLCTPLRRRDSPSQFYEYERPFGLAQFRRVLAGEVTIELDRCGQRRHRVLAQCMWCRAELSAGAISWIDGRVVHLYRPATGRHLRWRLAASDVPAGQPFSDDRIPKVAHTRYRIYVSLPPAEPGGEWRILSAPIG